MQDGETGHSSMLPKSGRMLWVDKVEEMEQKPPKIQEGQAIPDPSRTKQVPEILSIVNFVA